MGVLTPNMYALTRIASSLGASCSGSSSAQLAFSGISVRCFAGFTAVNSKRAAAVTSKKKRGPSDEDDPRTRAILQQLLPGSPPDQAHQPAPPSSEEEQQRHAELRRLRIRESHALKHDLSVKLKLQREALRALPERLRKLAMEPDLTPFPLNRKYLYDTPPESYLDIPAKAGGGGSSSSGGGGGSGKGGR